MVGSWPPIWVGYSRFLCAGLLLLAVLRAGLFGLGRRLMSQAAKGAFSFWLRGGLEPGGFIVAFNWALHFS